MFKTKAKLSEGIAHKMPADLEKALRASPQALKAWEEKITPLARNEWICWNVTVKLDSTRKEHIKRTISELKEGVRRPCCWAGCIHRTDKPLSPTGKWLKSKNKQ